MDMFFFEWAKQTLMKDKKIQNSKKILKKNYQKSEKNSKNSKMILFIIENGPQASNCETRSKK